MLKTGESMFKKKYMGIQYTFKFSVGLQFFKISWEKMCIINQL